MKATKFTTTITIQSLSEDSIIGIIQNVCIDIQSEKSSGAFSFADGDYAEWKIITEKVEF